MIHELSPRASQHFQTINCAAVPDSLFESEIFGYEKGAFTGAVDRKQGRVELSDRGTLFLDEIGDLTLVAPGQAAARPRGSPFRAPGRAQVRPRRLQAYHRHQSPPRGAG
jgi:hypothetical protein